MPLYKTKILSQRENILNSNIKNAQKKKTRNFKTPLIQSVIRLNDFDSDRGNISEKQDYQTKQTKKTLTKKPSQNVAPLEFHINSKEILRQNNVFRYENIEEELKRLNTETKQPKIPTKQPRNDKPKNDVHARNKKGRSISNIYGDEKEKTHNWKENKVTKNSNVIPKKDNNKVKKQVDTKKSTKTYLKKNEAGSDLDESIISLWQQSNTTPSLEPPEHLTYFERLLWLQDKRNVGLYVQCNKCNRYRYLKDTADPLDLPDIWYCSMNSDKNYNKCSDPEYNIPIWEEEDLIHNLYNAGSVVWAKLDGYPWWPAMVDDDPDTEVYYWLNEFSDIPTDYHVAFFDSKKVTRAWLKPDAIMKFKGDIDNPVFELSKLMKKYKTRINAAKEQAKNALKLKLANRLKNYSFIARWAKPINVPKVLIKEEQNKNRQMKRIKNCEVEKVVKKSKTNPKKNNFNINNFIREIENDRITPSISSSENLSVNTELLNDIDFNFSNF